MWYFQVSWLHLGDRKVVLISITHTGEDKL